MSQSQAPSPGSTNNHKYITNIPLIQDFSLSQPLIHPFTIMGVIIKLP
jgi:hypothetical protein